MEEKSPIIQNNHDSAPLPIGTKTIFIILHYSAPQTLGLLFPKSVDSINRVQCLYPVDIKVNNGQHGWPCNRQQLFVAFAGWGVTVALCQPAILAYSYLRDVKLLALAYSWG